MQFLRRIVVIAASVALLLSFERPIKIQGYAIDYIAFRCGAEAALGHHSTLAVEPLRSCENRVRRAVHPSIAPETVVFPSPIPPYAAILFAPFVFIPDVPGLVIWYGVELCAVGLTFWLTTRMIGISAVLLWGLLFYADIFQGVVLGQIAPLVVALIVASIWLRLQKRPVGAALCAAATMIEPHIGLAVCLSLWIVERHARRPLFISGIALAGLSLCVADFAAHRQYFLAALPAHALAEVRFDLQLSVTHFLWIFGMPDRMAVQVATVVYVAAVAAAAFVTYAYERSGKRRGDDYAVGLLLPATAASIGNFLHLAQFAVVGLLLAYLLQKFPKSALLTFAAVSFSIPLILLREKHEIVYFALPALVILLQRSRPAGALRLAAVCAAFAATFAAWKYSVNQRFSETVFAKLLADIAHANNAGLPLEQIWQMYMQGPLATRLGRGAVLEDAPLIFAAAVTLVIRMRMLRDESGTPDAANDVSLKALNQIEVQRSESRNDDVAAPHFSSRIP